MGEGSTNSALERMLSSLIEHEEEFRELRRRGRRR